MCEYRGDLTGVSEEACGRKMPSEAPNEALGVLFLGAMYIFSQSACQPSGSGMSSD